MLDWTILERAVAGAGRECDLAVAARFIDPPVRWDWRGDVQIPAASTIKLAILVAFMRAVDDGQLDFSERVALKSEAKVPGTGVLLGLSDGLSLTLSDLVYLMIAVSDNTASNLLLDRLGIPAIASTTAALGLSRTELKRRFLGRAPRGQEPENFTSANDLVTLLSAIAEDTAASAISCARMRELLALQQHRDRIARFPPNGVAFGGKSGTLPGLCHDSGLLHGPTGTLALAVLSRIRPGASPYAMDERIGHIAAAACKAVGWGSVSCRE
ncbi:MAG: class A beta-lactamase-related serine hydrolase [Chloroflexota bacterium]|nr:class A beta-lactamase-related serine hydrolase [Chloroflexota bacterium]